MHGPNRSSEIYYEARGRGRPFFLLHASPSDHARAMAQVEPVFRDRRGWQRIYPDLPGHGRSPSSSRIRDMDDYLAAVLDFVDERSGGERFALGGISFGAYLALAVARKRRARMDGLLLSVPEIHHSPAEDRADRARRTPSTQTPRRWSHGLPPYREDTDWLEALPFRDVSVSLYRTAPDFGAPALFLLGRQDAPFRYRAYARVLPGFPHATLALLDGAGHHLWWEKPEVARSLVRDWLDRVERYAPRTSSRRAGE